MMNETSPELVSYRSSSPSEAVVFGVAKRENVDPTELPPLHDTVDADALDRIAQGPGESRVTFEYAGYEVAVAGRDRVSLRETTPDGIGGGE